MKSKTPTKQRSLFRAFRFDNHRHTFDRNQSLSSGNVPMPIIKITIAGEYCQPYRFTLDRKKISIGRGADCDIVIDCPSVSPRHCTMKRVDGGYILRDRKSTNGITLDEKAMAVINLRNNSNVKIGDVEFDYELNDEELDYLLDEEKDFQFDRSLEEHFPPKPFSTLPMKKNLTYALVCCSALAILVLLFPFRTAVFKVPGKTDSTASLGPTFIFASPSKIKISNAIFESDAKELRKNYRYSFALQSRVDYGRTLLLMTLFIAGALGSFFWLRKLE